MDCYAIMQAGVMVGCGGLLKIQIANTVKDCADTGFDRCELIDKTPCFVAQTCHMVPILQCRRSRGIYEGNWNDCKEQNL